MRGNELLDKMELVDPAYVEAADAAPKVRKNTWVKWGTIAACLFLVFRLAVPAMAASIPTFYDMLYAVSPSTAQFFRPVQLSCEKNGIRMEVVAAYIHENTAEIYISLQDLEAARFDETIDLFDSYSINTPFACIGHCRLSDYDPDTQTATFLVTIEQMEGQNIIGDKLTFSIREFLSNKETYARILEDVCLDSLTLTSDTQTVQPRGRSGSGLAKDYIRSNTVLRTAGSISSPVPGVTVTGIGYVDGNLHVQVYYEDIFKTDNHGSIALFHSETGEQIPCSGTISFFDDAREGSYEDYIFPEISADALGDYELYGTFVTSQGPVEGNWSVTFPLENTDRYSSDPAQAATP